MKQIQIYIKPIFLVLMAIFTYSCGKDEVQSEQSIENSEIQNVYNPFDSIGLMHNEFLNLFIDNVEYKNGIIDRTEFIRIIGIYYNSLGIHFDARAQAPIDEMFDIYAKTFIPNTIKPYQCLGNICKCWPWICTYWPWPELPFSLLTTELNSSEHNRMIAFIEAIKSQELNVIQSKTISSEEKEFYLKHYAVARYSGAYWHNVIYDAKLNNAWKDHIETTRICVSCILKSDAEGAALGGILGSGLAGVGAGVGAVVGAGIASLLEGFGNKTDPN